MSTAAFSYARHAPRFEFEPVLPGITPVHINLSRQCREKMDDGSMLLILDTINGVQECPRIRTSNFQIWHLNSTDELALFRCQDGDGHVICTVPLTPAMLGDSQDYPLCICWTVHVSRGTLGS
jgi:hypothetical protein